MTSDICSESRAQVEENLERCGYTLEKRGMKVSQSKTECMRVNEKQNRMVMMQGVEVNLKTQAQLFRATGRLEKRHRRMFVISDRRVAARLKGKVEALKI